MKQNYPANLIFLVIAAILLLLPFHAVAGGFLLFEQGVKGLRIIIGFRLQKWS